MTAPRPRRPRALKIFAVGMTDGFLPPWVLDAIGVPSHVRQAPYYVVAATKKDALARLSAVGMFPSPSVVRVHCRVDEPEYNPHLTALRDAGLLTTDGEIVTFAERAADDKVAGIALLGPDRGQVTVWGERQLVVYVGNGPHRHEWFAVRHADGARFLERRANQEPTPATGWTGPTGERVIR